MTYTITPGPAYTWDINALPKDIRAAWIGSNTTGNLKRLTDTHFAFRARSGETPWIIGTLDELLSFFLLMSPAVPYRPPTPAEPDGFDVLDLSSIIVNL